MNIGAHIALEARRNVADAEFPRPGDRVARRHGVEVIDRRERKSRLLRHGGKTAEEAGKPKTYAVFVGVRGILGNDGAQ